MISNSLQHTYRDQGRKFYAFFLNFSDTREYEVSTRETKVTGNTEPRTRTYEGCHFFVFDQAGYVWLHAFNVSNPFVEAIADGFFFERPAWEADTDTAYCESLDRDAWLPGATIDTRYALETVREATGLDVMMLYRGTNGVGRKSGELTQTKNVEGGP
ncbi:hypothetical protein F4X10_08120 [Candidatus Poribacteria bacterium]|nr:hypothetical protein [Candidatus Poribacteria bacterium]